MHLLLRLWYPCGKWGGYYNYQKGSKNKLQVSLDVNESFQNKPKQYSLLNAQQFATLSNEVEAADSTHTYHGVPIWKTPNALHSVDWQNGHLPPWLTQNYSIGIRGGSDKVQSAVSFGYYDQKGIVLGSFFKRFTWIKPGLPTS